MFVITFGLSKLLIENFLSLSPLSSLGWIKRGVSLTHSRSRKGREITMTYIKQSAGFWQPQNTEDWGFLRALHKEVLSSDLHLTLGPILSLSTLTFSHLTMQSRLSLKFPKYLTKERERHDKPLTRESDLPFILIYSTCNRTFTQFWSIHATPFIELILDWRYWHMGIKLIQ